MTEREIDIFLEVAQSQSDADWQRAAWAVANLVNVHLPKGKKAKVDRLLPRDVRKRIKNRGPKSSESDGGDIRERARAMARKAVDGSFWDANQDKDLERLMAAMHGEDDGDWFDDGAQISEG